MSLSSITTSLLENPICILNFSNLTNLHSNCLREYCTQNNGAVCLTKRMQNYLQSKYEVYESADFREQLPFIEKDSDWGYIQSALKENSLSFITAITKEVAKSSTHRLRLKQHRDLGLTLMLKVMDSLRSFYFKYGAIWGVECDFSRIEDYRFSFKTLCRESESQSIEEIYRLYDLSRGGIYHGSQFPASFPLCLLFALGHGQKFPQSLTEFISRFQFFEAFVKENFKNTNKSELRKEKDLKQLASEKIGEIAYKLWEGHLTAVSATCCSHLIQNTQLLKAIEEHLRRKEHELPKTLQFYIRSSVLTPLKHVRISPTPWISSFQDYQLKSKMRSQLHRAQRAVNFRSDFDAAYHPFKHKEAIDAFFQRPPSRPVALSDYESWSAKTFVKHAEAAIQDYMRVISGVMEDSSEISVRPTQFDQGTVFTFACERQYEGERHIIKVHATGFENGISYILTGF